MSNDKGGVSAMSAELERFEAWWQTHGQYCRAGGGEYEKTFAFRAWEAAQSEERVAAELRCAKTPVLIDGHHEYTALKVQALMMDAVSKRSNAVVQADSRGLMREVAPGTES